MKSTCFELPKSMSDAHPIRRVPRHCTYTSNSLKINSLFKLCHSDVLLFFSLNPVACQTNVLFHPKYVRKEYGRAIKIMYARHIKDRSKIPCVLFSDDESKDKSRTIEQNFQRKRFQGCERPSADEDHCCRGWYGREDVHVDLLHK